MEKISREFIQYNWTKSLKPVETIFYEFDAFYGLKGKQELDRNMIDGGMLLAIPFLEKEYNSIPYIKRTYFIV